MSAAGARIDAFIARHVVAWELAMAALAVVYVGLGFIAPTPEVAMAETFLTGVFALEFAGRLGIARDRRAYLRGHWIDLVALLPATRAVRLVRLLRLVRAFAGLFRALSQVERLAEHRGLVWLFVIWLSVAVICSLWLYAAEAEVNQNIRTPLDALWWGVVTLTTVGYGDVYPQTPEGRVAAVVLMVVGITLYGTITATITSILLAGRRASTSVADELERVAMLARDGSLTPEEFARAKATILR